MTVHEFKIPDPPSPTTSSTCQADPHQPDYPPAAPHLTLESVMNPLVALHVMLLTLTDQTRSWAGTALASRRQERREQDRQAGLSTLEITVLALGLFLIAGIAVVVLTSATKSRLNQIK